MKKNYAQLVLCYILWGFQPLYWISLEGFDSFTILALRIIFAAVFSCLILAFSGRLSELKSAIRDKAIMKYILPAIIFLFADWAVFIVAVQSGHVLDVSLGYYFNPLLIFAIGIIIYKEKCRKMQLFALGVAVIGVIVSTISLGKIPVLSLVIAFNWAVYASIKKNVCIDGVLSIAIETILLSVIAIPFLVFFRTEELSCATSINWLFIIGSGIVTALPMYLYSNTVSKLPLIVMCFAQYLSPTFNVICGLIMGEAFSKSQFISLAFFVAAIVIFTISEIRSIKKKS